MSKASDKAYVVIREMILSGDLAPGAQVVEAQLAEACGVSRTPIRQALSRLEAEFYITRNDSQRSFVTEMSHEEIEDSFELRIMLESYAAKRAARYMSPQTLNQINRINQINGENLSQATIDVGAFLEQNNRLHLLIIEAANSGRLAHMLDSLHKQMFIFRQSIQSEQESLQRSHEEHLGLADAFKNRDEDWARSLMTSHLMRTFNGYKMSLIAMRDNPAHMNEVGRS